MPWTPGLPLPGDGEIGAGGLGAGELGAGEIRAGETGAGEMGGSWAAIMGAGAMGAGEVGAPKIGAGAMGAGDSVTRFSGEIGAGEIGPGEIGAGQDPTSNSEVGAGGKAPQNNKNSCLTNRNWETQTKFHKNGKQLWKTNKVIEIAQTRSKTDNYFKNKNKRTYFKKTNDIS